MRSYIVLLIFNKGRRKTDSAPVRGDGYEPGSSKFRLQSQRRDVAQRAIGPGGGCERWGGGEKFSGW